MVMCVVWSLTVCLQEEKNLSSIMFRNTNFSNKKELDTKIIIRLPTKLLI